MATTNEGFALWMCENCQVFTGAKPNGMGLRIFLCESCPAVAVGFPAIPTCPACDFAPCSIQDLESHLDSLGLGHLGLSHLANRECWGAWPALDE